MIFKKSFSWVKFKSALTKLSLFWNSVLISEHLALPFEKTLKFHIFLSSFPLPVKQIIGSKFFMYVNMVAFSPATLKHVLIPLLLKKVKMFKMFFILICWTFFYLIVIT